jgi:hypothetical protein
MVTLVKSRSCGEVEVYAKQKQECKLDVEDGGQECKRNVADGRQECEAIQN